MAQELRHAPATSRASMTPLPSLSAMSQTCASDGPSGRAGPRSAMSQAVASHPLDLLVELDRLLHATARLRR
jgi:hypothetical protein